jgi:pantoate--beta-alanine ligase
MIICKTITSLQQQLILINQKQQTIGFVPTMGALHEGHLSLIRTSISQNECTVCSIFVNPTQFNNREDYNKYPNAITQDIYQLELTDCSILFLPEVEEMYPDGILANKQYNLGYLETILEGKYRLNHFQGVCQIVEKLLSIINPNQLFLGQKDYQQCMVIEKLIELMDRKGEIKLEIIPTIREKTGLAMSSRNARLNEAEKENATAIFKAMMHIKKYLNEKSIDVLEKEATALLQNHGFEKVDYIKICNATNLQEVQNTNSSQKLMVLIAASLNGVRLIDNIQLN